MKKGLLFIVAVALLYWGYYFIKKSPAKPLITGSQINAPVERARDIIHEANLNILEMSIEIFRQNEGRYPEELIELVEKDYLSKLPDSGEKNWEYDPQDGRVE